MAVGRRPGGVRSVDSTVAWCARRSGADLVGYLNYIHPYRVQILGEREIAYLSNATPKTTAPGASRASSRWSRRCWCWPTAAVGARRAAVDVRARPDPDVRDRESSAFVIDVLRAYLSKHFADRTTMHGVLMDILGLGVLITGESAWARANSGWS